MRTEQKLPVEFLEALKAVTNKRPRIVIEQILAEQTHTAKDGDLVVALTDNNEATLKYFYKEKDRIRLEPRNPSLKPFYVKACTVQGRFVSLLRGIPIG